MYQEHATKIQRYAQRNADNLEHVGQFVAFTIHNQFKVAVDQLQDYREGHYDTLDDAIPATHLAIGWLQANKDTLHWHLQDIWNSDYSDAEKTDYMLSYVASEVPGLGLIKAGFLLQMAYGLSACLDTHNLKRFNIPTRAFRSDKFKELRTAKSRRRKVKKYRDTCEKFGGTAKLWDTWCAYMAEKFYATYSNPDMVSSLHCEALDL